MGWSEKSAAAGYADSDAADACIIGSRMSSFCGRHPMLRFFSGLSGKAHSLQMIVGDWFKNQVLTSTSSSIHIKSCRLLYKRRKNEHQHNPR